MGLLEVFKSQNNNRLRTCKYKNTKKVKEIIIRNIQNTDNQIIHF